MHLEIRKFWENAGYEIEERHPVVYDILNSYWESIFYLKEKKIYKDLISLRSLNFPKYFIYKVSIGGSWMSEQDALKYLKMKVFW